MAGVLEMIVFACVDPQSLRGMAGAAQAWPPLAVYTLAFVLFWAVIAGASAITLLLAASPTDINSRSVR